jgi:hypothetical protein
MFLSTKISFQRVILAESKSICHNAYIRLFRTLKRDQLGGSIPLRSRTTRRMEVNFMKKRILALCLGLSIVLLSSLAFAAPVQTQIDTSKIQVEKIPGIIREAAVGPDLTVVSAKVIAAPIVGSTVVSIPLEITIKNKGTIDVTKDFNVGADGSATDGNVYGYEFFVVGETTHERSGVYVSGLAAGAEKTYQGMLIISPQPQGSQMNAGSKYKIRAMVDYNLDPDSGYYEWGVDETNEANNVQEINYPSTATLATAPISKVVVVKR